MLDGKTVFEANGNYWRISFASNGEAWAASNDRNPILFRLESDRWVRRPLPRKVQTFAVSDSGECWVGAVVRGHRELWRFNPLDASWARQFDNGGFGGFSLFRRPDIICAENGTDILAGYVGQIGGSPEGYGIVERRNGTWSTLPNGWFNANAWHPMFDTVCAFDHVGQSYLFNRGSRKWNRFVFTADGKSFSRFSQMCNSSGKLFARTLNSNKILSVGRDGTVLVNDMPMVGDQTSGWMSRAPNNTDGVTINFSNGQFIFFTPT